MRTKHLEFLLLLIIFGLLIGGVWWVYRGDSDERARCVQTGGAVVEVHGQHGWFCDR